MPNLTVLNVAEKNDAAKRLSQIMSNGNSNRREGFSKYNKIFEFEYNILNSNCKMIMTSVSGHLMGHEFPQGYRSWNQCRPVQLFEAPVIHRVPENSNDIKRTLHREVRKCQVLIIWTDGDREGENIGFEIIKVCQEIKPNIRLYRAKFSEITPRAINNATQNLVPPDENTSDAVMVRQELDLRIGAAFTRFQTLRLQKRFPGTLAQQVISYGSCQFPTLGFVVERYQQVQDFIPETFYKIKVIHRKDEESAEFSWQRGRLFNQRVCAIFCSMCQESPNAKVLKVTSKPKSKWRPLPLDTVELEKTASKKLRINAKETMTIAEKLYNKGMISYPRTETNIFPKGMNLETLVQHQTADPQWGNFANNILQNGGPNPRQGKKTDNAHPPIHPIKYVNNLEGNEKKVYEFIVRHFLACVSQDAQGHETTVEIEIAGEHFNTHGLIIIARNYLEVYIYEFWNAKSIPSYTQGEVFIPTSIDMTTGETQAPSLLSESDLIGLMEKHGIGTDATHADHIEKIKDRQYVGVQNDGTFLPGKLGMGLVEGYDAMGFAMSKPHLRAGLEADLKLICEGRKDKDVVLSDQIRNYKEVFEQAAIQVEKLDNALSSYFGEMEDVPENEIEPVSEPIRKCPKCGLGDMTLRKTKEGSWLLGCMNFPDCKNSLFFPSFVTNVTKSDAICSHCNPAPVHKLVFIFKRGSVPPMMMSPYTSCIGGCDDMLLGLFSGGGARNESRPATNPNLNNNTQQNQRNRPSTNVVRPSTTNVRNANEPRRKPQTKTKKTQNKKAAKVGAETIPINNRSSYIDNGSNAIGLNQFNDSILEDEVKCKCFIPAVTRTTMKEGPNKGRQFYCCMKHGEDKCNFFQWTDEPTRGRDSSSRSFSANNSFTGNNSAQRRGQNFHPPNDDSSSDKKCKCGTDAVTRVVGKDGPNKGRPFYSCMKSMNDSCGFFEWADENNDSTASRSFTNNTFNNINNRANNRNSIDQSFHQQGNDNSLDVKCKCGSDAVSRVVKKDGPNKGRPFYSCMKPMNESCGFFEWADEKDCGSGASNSFANNTRANNRNRNDQSFQPQGNDNSLEVQCKCGTDAVSRVVKKEGPNKGRPFYACRKPMNEGCGFFEWADEASGDGGGGGGGYSGGGGFSCGGGFGGRGGRRGSGSGSRQRKRKCGQCGEMGHDKRSCPMGR